MLEQKTKSKKTSGLKHWWHQKVTAIIILPLTLWFIISFPGFINLNYNEKLDWINYDINFQFNVKLPIVKNIISSQQINTVINIFSVQRIQNHRYLTFVFFKCIFK